MALTRRQEKFVEAYKKTGDARVAVVQAGYSSKSNNQVAVEANRLLKNKEVAYEIANFKDQKALEFRKEDFIDLALKDYRELDVTEPNKPRFLHLAGQAAGHIGTNDSRPNQTLNITLNKTELSTLPLDGKLNKLRALLEND